MTSTRLQRAYDSLPAAYLAGGFYSMLLDGRAVEAADFLDRNEIDVHNYYANQSLLHLAVRADSPTLLKKIVGLGLDVNTEHETERCPPLDTAVGYRKFRAAEWLIRNDSFLQFEKDGTTYLCWQGAIREGRLDIIKLMVEHGLELDQVINRPPTTPLAMAMMCGASDEIVAYLRSKGAKTPEELGLALPPPPASKPRKGKKK